MKIFALQGVNNTGKTCTLKLVINKLKDRGYTMNKPTAIDKDKYDIAVTLKSPQGKTICVYTQGDMEKFVNRAIEYFKQNNCEIGFCAVRSKGKGADKLYSLTEEKDGITVEFIPKAFIANASGLNISQEYINAVNDLQAEVMIKHLPL